MRRNRLAALLLWVVAVAPLDSCTKPGSPIAPAGVALATSFTLSGQIWGETGQSELALPGVSVRAIANGDVRTAVTGDTGEFIVGGLSVGVWTVRVSKNGYLDEERVLQIERDTTLNFSLAPQ